MSELLELDDVLESEPPAASTAEVGDILQRRFELSGPVRALPSERDANFRVDTSAGPYLLKITNAAEDPQVTDLQTAALRHLERESPSLPVPRLVAARDGTDQPREMLGGRPHIVRLMSFLHGRSMVASTASFGMRSAIGETLAKLDAGLSGFDHPASEHNLLWNAADALRARDLVRFVDDPIKRHLAETTFDAYEKYAAPVMPSLRKQVIHNDFNLHNVLFDDALEPRISGIIDFGDIITAPLVSEVSTALAYQDFEQEKPLTVVSDIMRAYHAHMPLAPHELDVVLDLVRARQVLIGVITAWRAFRRPGNSSYILKNSARAWAGLEALHQVSRGEFRRWLTQACGGKSHEA
jgi:hydroxylysine kinase